MQVSAASEIFLYGCERIAQRGGRDVAAESYLAKTIYDFKPSMRRDGQGTAQAAEPRANRGGIAMA